MKMRMKKICMAVGALAMFGALTVGVASCSGMVADYEQTTYEVDEKFENISISVDIAKVCLIPSEDKECRVVCHELPKLTYSVTVENNTLNVSVVDERGWLDKGISFQTPVVNVYLPEEKCGALSIEGVTGDVEIDKDFMFGDVDISVTTGNVTTRAYACRNMNIETTTGKVWVENAKYGEALNISTTTGDVIVAMVFFDDVNVNVTTGEAYYRENTCKNLTHKGTTGAVRLNGTMVVENCSIETTTGNVRIEKSDSLETFTIKTTTGNVTGVILSEKDFDVKTTTGNVEVPKDGEGGKCEISTTTGNVEITIAS